MYTNFHRICIDKPIAIKPDECIVYSFGSNGDWTFEELMENYGCRVYVFDHRLIKLGDHQHSPNIKFHLIGLNIRDVTAVVVDEYGLNGTSRFRTLSKIYKMMVPEHGKKIVDYLK